MSQMNAWILEFGNNYKAAVGGRELLHLIDAPVIYSVPHTPHFCNQVVSWQENLLPVMDMSAKLSGNKQVPKFIAVIGYQKKRGEQPIYAGLQLDCPPKQVFVSDEQACKLPESAQIWSEIAISCFEYLGEAIPVINLQSIFDNNSNVQ
jgi:chemotaxis signal transduction protein